MTLKTARNLLIALALAATAAPLAAASPSVCVNDHDQGASSSTCIEVGSSSWGSCDDANGSEMTGVTLRQDEWSNDGYAHEHTSVGANCYAYTYEWGNESYTGSGNAIGVTSYGYDSDGGWHQTSATWYTYSSTSSWGSYSACNTETSVDGEYASYGCPAGTPPRVPAILP